MRENRLYGSEGGGAARRSPYPYPVGRPHELPRLAVGLKVIVHQADLTAAPKPS